MVDRRRRGSRRFAKARLNEAAGPPGRRQSSMWESESPSANGGIHRGAVGFAFSVHDASMRPRECSHAPAEFGRVRDADPMGVSTVVQVHLLGDAEGRLGVDHSVGAVEDCGELGSRSRPAAVKGSAGTVVASWLVPAPPRRRPESAQIPVFPGKWRSSFRRFRRGAGVAVPTHEAKSLAGRNRMNRSGVGRVVLCLGLATSTGACGPVRYTDPGGSGGNYYGQNAYEPSGQSGRSAAPPPSPWVVEVHYEPPSSMSRWGFRVVMVPLENDADGHITQRLSERINQTHTFDVVTGGAMHIGISGAVVASHVGDERVDERSARCSRTIQETRSRRVPYEVEDPEPAPSAQTTEEASRQLGESLANIVLAASGRPMQPRSRRSHTEYRDEEYSVPIPQPYECTTLVRRVSVEFRLRVRVMARTHPPRVVYEHEFALQDHQETTGRRGSDNEDHEPDPVDGQALLRSLEDRALSEFASANLPETSTETIHFEDCHEPRCEAAVALVRGGSMPEADRTLSELIREHASPRHHLPEGDAAAALYDRGLVRAYSGQFEPGLEDINRAIALSPGHAEWESRLATINQMVRAVGLEVPPPTVIPNRRPAAGAARRGVH